MRFLLPLVVLCGIAGCAPEAGVAGRAAPPGLAATSSAVITAGGLSVEGVKTRAQGRRLVLMPRQGSCLDPGSEAVESSSEVTVTVVSRPCDNAVPVEVGRLLAQPLGLRRVVTAGSAREVPFWPGCVGRQDETLDFDGCQEGAPPPP